MLAFLLDEHISPAVGAGIAVLRPLIRVEAMQSWRNEALLGADDPTILLAAATDGLTLVTSDLRTIPPLLKAWTDQGRSHGGVVLVPRQTIRASDIGGLARALVSLWDASATTFLMDRIVYLRAGAASRDGVRAG